MAVLLLAEVSDGDLNMDATAKAVAAASKLGDVTALCAGASAAAAGEAAAKIAGVTKVLVAEDASLGPSPGRADRGADRQPRGGL